MTITGKVKPRIEIAPGANPAASPSTYVYEDAGKRRAKADITITAGRDDEANEVEAGSLEATMDNRDGRLSPRNPLGQWYGKLGRGTPLRVVLDRTADDFSRIASNGWGTSSDGYTWSMSNTPSFFAVSGGSATATLPAANTTRAVLTAAGSPDAEIVWSTVLDELPTGANFVSGGILRFTDSSNYLRAHVEFTPSGDLAVKIQRWYLGELTEPYGFTILPLTYSAGDKVWGKARADGPYVMLKTWVGDLADEPDGWHAATTDDAVEGAGVGIFLWRLNTGPDPFVAKIDDFSVTNILWAGNVPEWSPRWPEKSGTDSTVPVSAAGILRRLAQGSSPLNSPLRSQLARYDPWTYLPLEEESGAQQAISTDGRTVAGINGEVTFGDDEAPNGAARSAQLVNTTTSQIRVHVRSTPTPDGFAVLWLVKLDSLPSSAQQLISLQCSGTMRTWALFIDNSTIEWTALDSSGAEIASAGSTHAVDLTQWTAMQIETNVSGGTTSVEFIWHQVGDETFYALTDTYSGTSSKPNDFGIAAVSPNMHASHLWFGDNDLPFVDVTFMLVSDGYRTEQAGDRIARLCAENNVPVYVLDGDSEPMGRQRPAKLVDLLRECEAADQGVICERGNALMYIPRTRRYNPPVAMALDWALGHLKEAPEPTDDDQRFRNQWTVTRTGGGTVTVLDQDSIDTAGTYDDSAELNFAYDNRTVDFASWFLGRDTIDVLRWPRITIDLVAHPELIPMWLACRIGSRITVANPPAVQLAGQVIDLILEGYAETINNYAWTVEMACSPSLAWLVGVYDGTVQLADSSSTTLKSIADEDDTSLIFRSADRFDEWGTGTDAGGLYDVEISGEQIRVTTMGAASTVSGAIEQTATVTRAVNGVQKSLAAGEPIHVYRSARLAL